MVFSSEPEHVYSRSLAHQALVGSPSSAPCDWFFPVHFLLCRQISFCNEQQLNQARDSVPATSTAISECECDCSFAGASISQRRQAWEHQVMLTWQWHVLCVVLVIRLEQHGAQHDMPLYRCLPCSRMALELPRLASVPGTEEAACNKAPGALLYAKYATRPAKTHSRSPSPFKSSNAGNTSRFHENGLKLCKTKLFMTTDN